MIKRQRRTTAHNETTQIEKRETWRYRRRKSSDRAIKCGRWREREREGERESERARERKSEVARGRESERAIYIYI